VRHAERLARAAAGAREAGLAALLVPPSPDLRYLVGHEPPPLERLTLLVVRPDRPAVLVVPELERPMALASPAGELVEVAGWRDDEDPFRLVSRLLARGGRLAVGDHMWASHVLGLRAAVPEAELDTISRAMPLLRAVKDPDELALLERAGRGADRAFEEIAAERFEGRTEEQIARRLAELLRRHDHADVTFTIVGSGPNGASPHHTPTGRRIAAGECVVLDFGGRVEGYCSDITRTVSVGRPALEASEVHAVVLAAQEAAFRAIRPGVAAQEVDRAARGVIEAAGLGDRFIHRTGHGIGLEEHEPPYIVRGNGDRLLPGMCFSIEPGVYSEGSFGVRIEDIVAVTDAGAVRLNEARRDLVVVA
jgi:Xaa-Pro aminopeptidase